LACLARTFGHHEDVPFAMAQKVIEESKQAREQHAAEK
jgi:hypothetical protein